MFTHDMLLFKLGRKKGWSEPLVRLKDYAKTTLA